MQKTVRANLPITTFQRERIQRGLTLDACVFGEHMRTLLRALKREDHAARTGIDQSNPCTEPHRNPPRSRPVDLSDHEQVAAVIGGEMTGLLRAIGETLH